MRWLVVSLLVGCGRISFDEVRAQVDDAAGDGSSDSVTDGPGADTPTVRACQSNPAYVGSSGLANRYREGVATVTWVDARADCMADEADLWVVDNATEQNAFTGDWTGITDVATEGVWLKLDGTVATFLPFVGLEPDGGTAENCLRNDEAGFEDRDCTDLRDYVCECPMN